MRSRLLLLLFAVLATGCGSESTATDQSDATQPPALGTAFDPNNVGTITGRVQWQGVIPNPPGFLFCTPQADGRGFIYNEAENPNRPHVEPKTRAVAGAVVFLRGIDSAKARPWDLPPVRVEMGTGRITVAQGERKGRIGFVRRGDAITALSTDAGDQSHPPIYHILRGRGDAFFSLTLPDAQSAVSRTLTHTGRVELSSATGLYWARADLFVADQPYFTVTDTNGRFTLENVPAGDVEIVVWLPGWEIGRQERDPDSTAITRMSYSPPIERVKPVTMQAKQTAEAVFSVP